MKVLLSVYACEPGKGSEPGVGWRWACGLSDKVTLTVLTRKDNRRVIEEAVAKLPEESPVRLVKFLYYDLPSPFLRAKRRGILPTLGYYIIWQWSVARKFRAVADEMDVVHHLTFCTLLCPGFWRLKKARYLLGPVGAPMVNPHYLSLFGKNAWKQRLRGWIMVRFLHLPWLKRLLRTAAAVVPANTETQKLLTANGIMTREIMLDTGSPEPVRTNAGKVNDGKVRFLYAGQLEQRKGLELALKAFGKVSANGKSNWTFDLFGKGPELTRLKTLADTLAISEMVTFHGVVAQTELMNRFDQADVFVFTSVRDTSGGVNLEAMAHGLPIVCIDHQGVGDITTEKCALKVAPGELDHTVNGLSRALIEVIENKPLRKSLGSEARRRAREDFPWEQKFQTMVGYYRSTGTADATKNFNTKP